MRAVILRKGNSHPVEGLIPWESVSLEGGRSIGKADPVKELMPWGVINCNSLANICRLLESYVTYYFTYCSLITFLF